MRGGVEPARYKDYVLILLFHKYVSDRYKGDPFSFYNITDETSFDALQEAKGKSDIGERVDGVLRKFMEDNQLQGSLPDVSFNNTDELGSGKELVDKVSGLIGVFQNPAIDFRTNRASGDDIIGDAYEYFMKKFAQESGKSKGQFYTPSEVSRIIARLIGIGDIKPMPDKSWTLYDPAAGSGSLLIRAADEAPRDAFGDPLVTISGQEKDHSTAGLANMNLVLSLPANLFYGTGIPACLVFIDKENAETRKGIFFIDASGGFVKDGDKNRLREQDIEKIVRVYTAQEEIRGYSRMVLYSEIMDENTNNGNMNVPRYIQKVDDSLPQNIAAHLRGGIPKHDIDTLDRLWAVSGDLKDAVFTCVDTAHDIYQLTLASDAIEAAFDQDVKLQAERRKEGTEIFEVWRDGVRALLLGITGKTEPRLFIRQLGSMILEAYADSLFLNHYDVFDCLMNYWNEKLQDDVYAIKAYGYETAREIEYTYAKKKAKDESGEAILVDDKSKVKSFDGALIPRTIIEAEYFADELAALQKLTDRREQIASDMEEMREEESGEEGLLRDVLTGGDLTKANLRRRIKFLESKKTSPEMAALQKIIDLFESGAEDAANQVVRETPALENYGICGKTLARSKLRAALKAAAAEAVMPEAYRDEYEALLIYQGKQGEYDALGMEIKAAQKALDDLVLKKFQSLTDEEIKHLLFDRKWMPRLRADINGEIDRILNNYVSRVITIAKRYEHTLGEIEDKTAQSKEAVRQALGRMGSWCTPVSS